MVPRGELLHPTEAILGPVSRPIHGVGAVQEPELISKEGSGLGHLRIFPKFGHGESMHVQANLSLLFQKSSKCLVMFPFLDTDADQLMALHELIEDAPHGPVRTKVNQAQLFQVQKTPEGRGNYA